MTPDEIIIGALGKMLLDRILAGAPQLVQRVREALARSQELSDGARVQIVEAMVLGYQMGEQIQAAVLKAENASLTAWINAQGGGSHA